MGSVWDVLLGGAQVAGGLGVAVYKSRRAQRRYVACYNKQLKEVRDQFVEADDIDGAAGWLARFDVLRGDGPPVLEWYDDALSLARLAHVEVSLKMLQDRLMGLAVPRAEHIGQTLDRWTRNRLGNYLEEHTGGLTPEATDTIVSEMYDTMRNITRNALEHELSAKLQEAYAVTQDNGFLVHREQWTDACCNAQAGQDMGDREAILQAIAQQVEVTQPWVSDTLLAQFDWAIAKLDAVQLDAEMTDQLQEKSLIITRQFATQAYTKDKRIKEQIADLAASLEQLLKAHQLFDAAEAFSGTIAAPLQLLTHNVLDDLKRSACLAHALIHWHPQCSDGHGIDQKVRRALSQVCHRERKCITASYPTIWVWRAAFKGHWQAIVTVTRAMLWWCASIASVILAAYGLGIPSLVCQGLMVLCGGVNLYHQLRNDALDCQANREHRRVEAALQTHSAMQDEKQLELHANPFDARHPAWELLTAPSHCKPAKRPDALIGCNSLCSVVQATDDVLHWIDQVVFDTLMILRMTGVHGVLYTVHQWVGHVTVCTDWLTSCYWLVCAIRRYRAECARIRSEQLPEPVQARRLQCERNILCARVLVWCMDTILDAAAVGLWLSTPWLSAPVLLAVTLLRAGCKMVKERAKVVIAGQDKSSAPHPSVRHTAAAVLFLRPAQQPAARRRPLPMDPADRRIPRTRHG